MPFTVDTTVGVTISIYAMRAVASVAAACSWQSLVESGNYGPGKYDDGKQEVAHYVKGAAFAFDDRSAALLIWAKQLGVWCIITIGARACCGVLMYGASSVLQLLSEAIAHVFEGHARLFLVLVMLGCPVCMNLIQVWIQDNILRKTQQGRGKRAPSAGGLTLEPAAAGEDGVDTSVSPSRAQGSSVTEWVADTILNLSAEEGSNVHLGESPSPSVNYYVVQEVDESDETTQLVGEGVEDSDAAEPVSQTPLRGVI